MILMDASQFLGKDPTTYIIVPLVAAVAGVVALLRGDRTILRQDAEDLRNGRADDEKEIRKLKRQHEADQDELGRVTAENIHLRELNSARPEWSEVSHRVSQHNDNVESRWKVEDERARAFEKLLRGILEVLLERSPHLNQGSPDEKQDHA